MGGAAVSGLLFPPGDKRVFLAWLLLCLVSLAVLWSVTEPIRGPYEEPDPGVAKTVFWRQAVWLLVSWLALLVAARLPLRYLENVALPLYLLVLVLLVLVLVVGPRIGGAHRWLVLGPMRLQPSEVAKVTLVLATANLLGRGGGSRNLGTTVMSFLLMAAPMALVLREPDLGTSLVFVAIWVGMVFWYGMPGILLLGAASAVLSAVIMFYSESIAHNPWPWGLYLLLVLGVLYLVRLGVMAKVALLAVNVATGVGIPFFWDHLQALPAGAHPDLLRAEQGRVRHGLPGHPVQGGHRFGRPVRHPLPAGHPEGAGLPAGAAHRFHLLGGGRGTGPVRGGGDPLPVRGDRAARDRPRRGRAPPVRQLPGGGRGLLLHFPRGGERGRSPRACCRSPGCPCR